LHNESPHTDPMRPVDRARALHRPAKQSRVMHYSG
jgi:hypothetical protein